MSLTKAELLIAAEAADRWPKGTDVGIWGFTAKGRATHNVRAVVVGRG